MRALKNFLPWMFPFAAVAVFGFGIFHVAYHPLFPGATKDELARYRIMRSSEGEYRCDFWIPLGGTNGAWGAGRPKGSRMRAESTMRYFIQSDREKAKRDSLAWVEVK
jgi:hypothetical protein